MTAVATAGLASTRPRASAATASRGGAPPVCWRRWPSKWTRRTSCHEWRCWPPSAPSSLRRTMTDHPMRERLEQLAERKQQALHAGSERAVKRQHDRGKMTARERVEYLLDEASFVELDQLARHRAFGVGLDDAR